MHTIVLTQVYQGEIELTDEEYEEYLLDKHTFLYDRDAWSYLDVVETDIEEI